ncbi:MAG TPA: hypothetical protein VFM97_04770 [Gammaproteobacteria bacterium]|nr:hypothetical protein [Gammaproteobacteria bacterium]
MLLLIFPLLWAVLWALLAIVICAAAGIGPHDPRLWWYMAGIFVGGGFVLPGLGIGIWTKLKKCKGKAR